MSDQGRIEHKMDLILDRLNAIEITLAKQHMSLEEHMKRSDFLEKLQSQTKKEVGSELNDIKKEVAINSKEVYYLKGAAKLLIPLGLLAGIGKFLKGLF